MNRRDFLQRGAMLAGGVVFGRNAAWGAAAPAPAMDAPVAPLRRGVGYFAGRGGTIGTLVTPGIALVVDTQFPDSVGACLDEVKVQAGREADLAINTHHHGDHTGGNGTARGRGIRRIVAHENVPGLMRAAAARQGREEASEKLPAEGFSQRWRLDAGEEAILAEHFGPAHTGGDIIVLFEKAGVVHMGDLVFDRLHPVIDRPGGASIAGWISILEAAAARFPADTLFIFGHGRDAATGTRGDLLVMRDYLSKLIETVSADIKSGRTLEQIKERTFLEGCEAYGGTDRLPHNLETAFAELTAGA